MTRTDTLIMALALLGMGIVWALTMPPGVCWPWALYALVAGLLVLWEWRRKDER